MKELLELLEAHSQNETMIDRHEYVNTLEEMAAYGRGKTDGFTCLARQLLPMLTEINKKKQDLGFGKAGFSD